MEEDTYLATALAASRAGFSVLPPKEDGSKQPLDAWKQYQETPASEAVIRNWYAGRRTGIGAVMGPVSRNTELFEFDDAGTFVKFMEVASAAGLRPLVERIKSGYSERTPGGGIHWYYRCAVVSGSTRLACKRREDGSIKVLIETKGTGGYAIMAPSSGNVHPSKGTYERLAGSVETVAEISAEERAELWKLARSFDELGVDEQDRPLRDLPPATTTGDRPGDDYIARTTWFAVLEPFGWTPVFSRNGEVYWRRPGKSFGISATTNFGGSDLLYVFTTSTPFTPSRAYNRFSAYAVLAHDGDYAAAARALRADGYGRETGSAEMILPWEQTGPSLSDIRKSAGSDESDDEDDKGESAPKRTSKFQLIDLVDMKHRPRPRWQVEDVMQENTFVAVYGPPGSYKTFFVLDLVMSLALGRPFQGKRTKAGKVLYILAEGQGGFGMRVEAWERGRNIEFPRNEVMVIDQAVALHDASAVSEMVLALNEAEFEPSAIVFDTLAQNMPGTDENSSQDMGRAVDFINKLRKRFACTVIIVHHGRKSDGAMRGWSGLLGALHTVIRITAEDKTETGDGKVIEVFMEKQKEGEMGQPIFYLKPVSVELPAAPTDDLPEDDDLDGLVIEAVSTSVVLERMDDKAEQRLKSQPKKTKPAALKGWALRFANLLVDEFGLLGATDDQWKQAALAQELLVKGKTQQPFYDAKDSLLLNRWIRKERRDGADWYYATDALARRLQAAPGSIRKHQTASDSDEI